MFWFKNSNRSKSLDDSPSVVNDIQERGHERIDYETPIGFENYETGEVSQGSVINYSEKGLYIELEDCPQKGTGAVIHMSKYDSKAEGPNGLSKYYVEVKWVKQIPDEIGQNRYSIGVEHCSDIYDLFRLFGY
jgi:hypothetical protein